MSGGKVFTANSPYSHISIYLPYLPTANPSNNVVRNIPIDVLIDIILAYHTTTTTATTAISRVEDQRQRQQSWLDGVM